MLKKRIGTEVIKSAEDCMQTSFPGSVLIEILQSTPGQCAPIW